MSLDHWWNETDREEQKIKPVPVPVCPQISHALAWNQTHVTAMSGRPLIAWAIA